MITDPKRRSQRWLATSLAGYETAPEWALVSSAEFHTHNFLSSVDFRRQIDKLPENVAIVEASPGFPSCPTDAYRKISRIFLVVWQKAYSHRAEITEREAVISVELNILCFNNFFVSRKTKYDRATTSCTSSTILLCFP